MIDRKKLVSEIPVKYLAYGLALALADKLQSPFRKRFKWKVTDVGNSLFPDADLRTYYEAHNIRQLLRSAIGDSKVGRACEIGCGYGRVTPVLTEFSREVLGFERETSLVNMARAVVKDIEIVQVTELTQFRDRGTFDLIMVCTVLQHLADQECARLLSGIQATVNGNGYVLLIENTDTRNLATIGDAERGDRFLSRPRTRDDYVAMMKPLELVKVVPRELEKGFGSNAGELMLFHRN
jgi:2-polyprenyl-3-methyl-5-hydroxy-6-metoxy-1,4-benzoquinol methylase